MADGAQRTLNHLFESRRKDPDRGSAYIDRINQLYDALYPPGSAERAKADQTFADVLGYEHTRSFTETILNLPVTDDRTVPQRVALGIEHALKPEDEGKRRLFEKHLLENVLYLQQNNKLGKHPNNKKIVDVLDSIWRENPRTSGGRFVQEHAENLVQSKYTKRNIDLIRASFQQKLKEETWKEERVFIPVLPAAPVLPAGSKKGPTTPLPKEPTPEEVDFITRLETKPTMARNCSQKFRSAGSKGAERKPWNMTIEGQFLVLQYSTIPQYIIDPITGKKETVEVSGTTLLDGDGRISEDKIFARTTHKDMSGLVDTKTKGGGTIAALDRENAELAREAFAAAVRGNMIFNDIYGLGKKLGGVLELEGQSVGGARNKLSQDVRKKARLYEAFYADKEGESRRSSFASDLAKDWAAKYSSTLEKYFRKHLGTAVNEVSMLRALGATDDQIAGCYSTDPKTGNQKFDALKGLIYATFEATNARIIANNAQLADDDKKPLITVEDARRMVLGGIGNMYVQYGFHAVEMPYKGKEGEKEFNAYYKGWRAYEDRGFAPEYWGTMTQEDFDTEIANLRASGADGAAKAQELIEIRDAVDGVAEDVGAFLAGKFLKQDGFSDAPNNQAEIIRGPNGIRIKIQMAAPGNTVRTVYLDAEDAYEYQVRTGNMAQAIAIRNQIQQFANDPLTYPVTWYYNSVGNMMLNMIPGARQAFDVTNGILHQRNSLLPKFKQLDPKQLAEMAKTFMKKNLLAPLFVYDPMTNMMIPRTAYILGQSVETGFEFLVGNEQMPGILDRFLRNRNIRVWKYDSATGKYEKKIWEPRVFKGIFQSERQKKRMGIFEIAIRMATGVMVNLVGDLVVGRVKQFTQIATQVRRFAQIPQNIYSKILPETGGVLSQQGLRNLGNWIKTGWGIGGTLVKTLGQSIVPAAIVGLAFNSPWMMGIAAAAVAVPNGLMNFASLAASNDFFASKFEGLDTLGKLLYKSHIDSAQIFGSANMAKVPKLPFGLERLIYETKATVIEKVGSVEKMGYKMRSGNLAKFLSNHANIRGVLKGFGRATNVFGLVYMLTGNIFTAALAAGGTMVVSVGYEHLASWVEHSMAKWQGTMNAISGVAKGAGTMFMGGVNVAVGMGLIKSGIEAFQAGGKEWDEWKEAHFGGAIPFASTAFTLIGAVQGAITIYNTAVSGGKFLLDFVSKRFANSVFGGAIGTYAKIGMIVGAIVGMLAFGTIGGIAGGMVGGALGGIAGGVLLGSFIGTTLFPVLGTAIGAIIGAIVGAIPGGLIGGWIGNWMEKNLNMFKNISSNIAAGMNILGNAMNIIQAIKFLFSRDLADVATGAFMLALAGVFTFSTVQNSSLASATYMASGGSGEHAEGPGGTINIPTSIKDFSKSTTGFSSDKKSITYKIHVSNSDDENRNMTIHFEDVLSVKDNAMQNDITYEILNGETVSDNRAESIITLTQQEKTLAVGEENNLEIKFNTSSKTFPDWISSMPSEKMCNTGKIIGQIDGGDTLSYSDTVCIDKDGNITGPGGKCPINVPYSVPSAACHPTSAIDFAAAANSEVYSSVNGRIARLRSPKDLTDEGRLSEGGCFDGGFVVDIVDNSGVNYAYWHLGFDTNSFDHFYVNGKELKVGDTVVEGQLIGWLWDGAMGDPTIDTCYQNPGGRTGLYPKNGVAQGTWWTGPHLHFGIYTGTPPCKAIIDFIDQNCQAAKNNWDHSYNY